MSNLVAWVFLWSIIIIVILLYIIKEKEANKK